MRTIEIFSVYKIDSFIKKWRKAFPTLSIQKVDEPTSNCYVLFKYDTNKTMRCPFEAIHGAHKGFIEGWIKECNPQKILQPEELEHELRKLEKENNDDIH